MGKRNRRFGRSYQQIFLAGNGDGPWSCYYALCDQLVQLNELLVHHIDENHENDDLSNLAPMHHRCHSKLHNTGRVHSDESRRNMGDWQRGKPKTEEHRQALSAARQGMTFTDAHRRHMSEAHSGRQHVEPRWRCGDCALETTAGNLVQHQRAKGHSGRGEV